MFVDGAKIRAFRNAKGLRRLDLAVATRLGMTTIQRMECGHVGPHVLEIVAKALGFKPEAVRTKKPISGVQGYKGRPVQLRKVGI